MVTIYTHTYVVVHNLNAYYYIITLCNIYDTYLMHGVVVYKVSTDIAYV